MEAEDILAMGNNYMRSSNLDHVTDVARESVARQLLEHHPGVVETEGTNAAGLIGSDFEKNAAARASLGRTGQPGDIASVAVFLASADSGWMTGEQLIASGGLR